VTVTTDGGTSATSSADQYTYLDLPTVTNVSPSDGPIAGGQTVTITGTALTGATGVQFGAAAGTNVSVTNATHLTVTAPAHSAGTVHVTVTTDGGTSATSSADQYTYLDVPAVTGVSPSDGPVGGGQTVTITGTALAGATAVDFGSTPATNVANVDGTHVTATIPAHTAGTVDVTVTTDGGTSATSAADQYTYVVAPTVTGVSPSDGPLAGGQTITITGTGLAGATAVHFGTTAATNVANTDGTHVTATIPTHAAGTVDVTVTTDGGTSATSAADDYTYLDTPTVTSVSPNAGPVAGGQTVTITGTAFTGAPEVDFGTAVATNIVVVDTTHLTATAPANAGGTVDVRVTTDGGTSATSGADHYTYAAAPTVTSVSPSAGRRSGGQSVTITGTNFAAGATVQVGGTPATAVVVHSATSITATVPAHAAGTVDVRVATAGGTSAVTAGDHYTYDARPKVTHVSPSSGAKAGGKKVVLTGKHFLSGASVKFGAKAGTRVKVVSATEIKVHTPAHAKGTVDVTVTTPGGTSATKPHDHYTFT
jgi:hypothetical protein